MPVVRFAWNPQLVAVRREACPRARWNSQTRSWTMTAAEVEAFVAAGHVRLEYLQNGRRDHRRWRQVARRIPPRCAAKGGAERVTGTVSFRACSEQRLPNLLSGRLQSACRCFDDAAAIIADQATPDSRWTNTVQLSNAPSLMSLIHSKRACSSSGSLFGGCRRAIPEEFRSGPCNSRRRIEELICGQGDGRSNWIHTWTLSGRTAYEKFEPARSVLCRGALSDQRPSAIRADPAAMVPVWYLRAAQVTSAAHLPLDPSEATADVPVSRPSSDANSRNCGSRNIQPSGFRSAIIRSRLTPGRRVR